MSADPKHDVSPPEGETLDRALGSLRKANRSHPSPWPVCKKCKLPMDPVDMHWLFRSHCDSHGIVKLEDLAREIVRSRGRRRGL